MEKLLIWAISPFATMFLNVVCFRGIKKRLYVGPFPTYNKSAAYDFEDNWAKTLKVYRDEGIFLKIVVNIVAKGDFNHLEQLSFCNIVFKSHMLQKRQKVSIC